MSPNQHRSAVYCRCGTWAVTLNYPTKVHESLSNSHLSQHSNSKGNTQSQIPNLSYASATSLSTSKTSWTDTLISQRACLDRLLSRLCTRWTGLLGRQSGGCVCASSNHYSRVSSARDCKRSSPTFRCSSPSILRRLSGPETVVLIVGWRRIT